MTIKKTDEVETSKIETLDTATKHKFGKKSPFSFKKWEARDKNYGYRYILPEEAERRTDEGFEVCPREEIVKLKPVAGKYNVSGAWEVQGLVLMRCPTSVIKERNSYYQNMWKDQISGDKQRLQEEADKNNVELVDSR